MKLEIKKAEAMEQVVFAEVYAPDRPDSDKDFMSVTEIRNMAYKFLKSGRLDQIDVQHDGKVVPGVHIVESFLTRKGDPDFPIEGAWAVGIHVDHPGTWDRIMKGELNGFSLEAMVLRDPIEIEIDIPPVVSGKTMKAGDGHEHTFHVAYDEEGNFKGGVTDHVNGHAHRIIKGTITELESGHSHRFHYIDLEVPA